MTKIHRPEYDVWHHMQDVPLFCILQRSDSFILILRAPLSAGETILIHCGKF